MTQITEQPKKDLNAEKKLIMVEITGNGYVVHTKNLFPQAPTSQIASNIKAVTRMVEILLTKEDEDGNAKEVPPGGFL